MTVRTEVPTPTEASLPRRALDALEQLPVGTVERFGADLKRGFDAAGVDGGAELSTTALRRRLLAPLLLDPEWPEPTPPLPVGDGAVHADLTDTDAEAFARLRSSVTELAQQAQQAGGGDGATGGPLDAETLAAEAQGWRLPVTPYRRPDPRWARTIIRATPGPVPTTATARADTEPGTASSRSPRRGDTPLVVDLTALWAGPLATSVLAQLGARVVKIDGRVRPDGLAERPAVYDELNRAKTIIDLDLRHDHDRARFESLLAEADLVIDSFSRRVMANLGYGPRVLAERFRHLRALSIVAFPLGCPEAEWVSYGPGVHAVCGLGHRDGDRPRPAPIAYPDALAGAAAFAAAAELLARRRVERRVELSLAGAVAPLLGQAS